MTSAEYITTPIYYVNADPHLGHAYTTLAADTYVRWRRQREAAAHLLTGTDEHGQKVERSAAAAEEDVHAWVDRLSARWRSTWDELGIAYDDFIRTTEPRHVAAVEEFLLRLKDAGAVYEGEYTGAYCVACEEFKADADLTDEGRCQIHETTPDQISETNWFFRLSDYAERLLDHYERHPEFVRPEARLNEVVGFVSGGLDDVSLSRSSTNWGIPVPWDSEQVAYVWFDALINYVSAVGFGAAGDARTFERFWPADVHFIGKDILRFHAVIWPAMLMAAGVELPTTVYAHGFCSPAGRRCPRPVG